MVIMPMDSWSGVNDHRWCQGPRLVKQKITMHGICDYDAMKV